MSIPILVSFPDLCLPNIDIDVTANTTGGEVIEVAANEWNVDPTSFNITTGGGTICSKVTAVVQYMLEPGAELIAIRKESITLQDLTDIDYNNKIDKRFEANPQAICILDASTMLDETGCFQTMEAMRLLIPTSVRRIAFTNCKGITEIGDSFLADCSCVTHIDLSAFTEITSVGRSFLKYCESLREIDLSPLCNVTEISDCFLFGCGMLTELNLSPLSKVETVESSFLRECSNIEFLDLSPLSNVTKIGGYFLYSCVCRYDLSHLSSVVSCCSRTFQNVYGFPRPDVEQFLTMVKDNASRLNTG